MPRATKGPPEGFTLDSVSGRVYCNVCSEERRRRLWLQKDSIRGHIKGKDHLTNIARSNERENAMVQQAHLGALESQHRGVLNHIDENTMSNGGSNSFGVVQDVYEILPHESLFDRDGYDVQFTAGDLRDETEDKVKKLQDSINQYELYGWRGEDFYEEEDDIGQTNVAFSLQASELYQHNPPAESDNESDSETNGTTFSKSGDPDWFPYKNKTMCMLDLLDSLPRLRLSDAQMKAILFVMKECGAENVPSLSTLRRLQKKLRKSHGVPVKQCISGRGSLFYCYDIAGQIAKDFANPLVRPHIRFYPEELYNELIESWNGKKWCHELDDSLLTPMAIGADNQHFYVNELTRTQCNHYIIPRRWTRKGEDLYAYSDLYTLTEDGKYHLLSDRRHLIPLHEMQDSFVRLREEGLSDEEYITSDNKVFELNPMRVKAAGKPCFAVQLKFWSDDVSGNKSKQWNKHWLWCMAHAGLPKVLLHQEYFIRYICCSQNATVLEQASEICDQIRATHEGVVAYDIELQEEVVFFVNMFQLSGDNPMLAELASHIGLNGNFFCYRCTVGGTQKHKTSAVGYEELFAPSTARQVASTREEAKKQLKDGLDGVSIEDTQRTSGVKDGCVQYWLETAEARTTNSSLDDITGIMEDNTKWIEQQTGVINPLLELAGFDPHLDGPVEPLHTVLLGVVKYCWTMTCEKIVSGKKLSIFQTRLHSVDTKGMNIPALRASYLIQYRGALIGRQFKALMQLMVFVLHGLLPDDWILLWRTLGEVGAYLWHPGIKDLKVYLKQVEAAIDNFLDCLAGIEAGRIVGKPKCHILTHIIKDILRFGPAIVMSTEMFEGFNAIWRLCSILSNHHAPSRDIALNLADMDRFKQLVSGVRWIEGNKATQAGIKVRHFMNNHPEVQSYMGLSDNSAKKTETGKATLASKKKYPPKPWRHTESSVSIPYFLSDEFDDETMFNQCTHVIAANGDSVKAQNYVIAQGEDDQDTVIGQVTEIVQHDNKDYREAAKTIVTMERFYIGGEHNTLMMPTIHRYDEPVKIRMEAKHIKCLVNVQHDCERGQCKPTAKTPEVQERLETTRQLQIIQHTDTKHFIINVQALHNVDLLRVAIPEQYYRIRKRADDRVAFHASLAHELHKKVDLRKETAKARREAAKAVTVAAQNNG